MFKKLTVFFILLIGLAGCDWFKKQEEIAVAQPKPTLFVVNVLDDALYEDCHIKGSIHVSFMDDKDLSKSPIKEWAEKLDKKAEVVFYCSNYLCTASGEAAKMLKGMGFENVWAYEAGMAEWHQKGLPCTGSCQQAYLKTKFAAKPETDKLKVISTEELYQKMKQHGLID